MIFKKKKVHDFRLKFKFNSKRLKTSEDNLREVRKKKKKLEQHVCLYL